MLSGNLWPAHPHPLQGESLSCYLVRLAHANGLKVQTFSEHVFGSSFQIWNRDIDRNVPGWVLEQVSKKTGVSIREVETLTLRLHEKRLFPHMHSASNLRWVMPIKHHHRLNTGFSIQYCPLCLKNDDTPYFRLSWRLALYTFCPNHRVMMVDRCPHCSNPVAFHRIELGKPQRIEVNTLDCCWFCDGKLSDIDISPVNILSIQSDKLWTTHLNIIDRQYYPTGRVRYEKFALLHQLCRLLISKKYGERVFNAVNAGHMFQYADFSHVSTSFELLSVYQRHAVLNVAYSLLSHRRQMLSLLKNKVITVNMLYRDLEDDIKIYVKSHLMRDRT